PGRARGGVGGAARDPLGRSKSLMPGGGFPRHFPAKMPHSARMAGKSAAIGTQKRPEPARQGRVMTSSPQNTAIARVVMAGCETCGNDYDKAFQVSMNGTTHTFDSFECAIHALAPTCENCGIRIVGHGLERDGTFFCCEHCAEAVGVTGLRDRIGAAA